MVLLRAPPRAARAARTASLACTAAHHPAPSAAAEIPSIAATIIRDDHKDHMALGKSRKRVTHHRPALNAASRNSTMRETVFLVGLVVAIFITAWAYHFVKLFVNLNTSGGDDFEPKLPGFISPGQSKTHSEVGQLRGSASVDSERTTKRSEATNGGFDRFMGIALDLSALEPDETLHRLETEDPFGTRTFDRKLMDMETRLGRVLTMDEIAELFPCPRIEERITLPDFRVEAKARAFRDGKRGTFLFFQHLRKA